VTSQEIKICRNNGDLGVIQALTQSVCQSYLNTAYTQNQCLYLSRK